MTKTKTKPKTSTSKPAPRDRVVYEVKGPSGTRQIDATTTAELRLALTPLLPLDGYNLQAAAHLVSTARVTMQGVGWGVKRLGLLAFQPDPMLTLAQTKSARSTSAPLPVQTPPFQPTLPTQPSHIPAPVVVSAESFSPRAPSSVQVSPVFPTPVAMPTLPTQLSQPSHIPVPVVVSMPSISDTEQPAISTVRRDRVIED